MDNIKGEHTRPELVHYWQAAIVVTQTFQMRMFRFDLGENHRRIASTGLKIDRKI